MVSGATDATTLEKFIHFRKWAVLSQFTKI